MEIKNLLDGLKPYEQQKKVGESDKAKASGRGEKSKSGASDKVSLSAEAKLRGVARSEAMSAEDVRAEKVADLKARVKDGTYKPDAVKTARNLIRDDLELLLHGER